MNRKMREVRDNLLSSLRREKGFTLIEILVVVGIIGLLFVVFLPRIDFAGDAARETGVQTDFRSFQVASEQYFRDTAGSAGADVEADVINGALDPALEFTDGTSAHEDPWGSSYVGVVDTATGDGEGVQITIETDGQGGDGSGYRTTTYYLHGSTYSCTAGLGTSNIEANFEGDISLGDVTPDGVDVDLGEEGNNCGNYLEL